LSQKIQCHEIPVDHGAADDRAERDAEPGDPRPDAQRQPSLGGGKASDSIVSVSGVTIAAPAPWKARAATSARCRRRQRGRRRGDREQCQPAEEHPPATEAIAERRAGQQQYGERQRVGVDGPLESEIDAPRLRRMLGSAVETTRLSSVAMNSAIETIASVQPARADPAAFGAAGRRRRRAGSADMAGLSSSSSAGERLLTAQGS